MRPYYAWPVSRENKHVHVRVARNRPASIHALPNLIVAELHCRSSLLLRTSPNVATSASLLAGVLALDNRQQFPRSKCRATDRSVTCFLKAWNRSALSAAAHAAPRRTPHTQPQTARYPNPDFQSSIRVVFDYRGCLFPRLLFLSPRATKHNKIRVFVNSFTGEGSPGFQPGNQTRTSGRARATCSVLVFLNPTTRVVEVCQSNRSSRPCKPPARNRLHSTKSACPS